MGLEKLKIWFFQQLKGILETTLAVICGRFFPHFIVWKKILKNRSLTYHYKGLN